MAQRGGQIHRIELSDEERHQLDAISRSRSLPHGLVRRAQIILISAENVLTAEIAKVCGTRVSRWRSRFRQAGLASFYDELREGRPRSISTMSGWRP